MDTVLLEAKTHQMCRICTKIRKKDKSSAFKLATQTKNIQLHSIYDFIEDFQKKKIQIHELLNCTVPTLPKIEIFDVLPKMICKQCLDKLKDYYEFQQRCLQSDFQLRSSSSVNELKNNSLDPTQCTMGILVKQETEDTHALNNVKDEGDEFITSDSPIEIRKHKLNNVKDRARDVDNTQEVEHDSVNGFQQPEDQSTPAPQFNDGFIKIENDDELILHTNFDGNEAFYVDDSSDMCVPATTESSENEEIYAVNEAEDVSIDETIPEKSKPIYERHFNNFCEWMTKNNKNEIDEILLLTYFKTILKEKAPSTKWCIYSILKKMLKTQKGVDIADYNHMIAYLKRKTKSFQPGKEYMLQKSQMLQFIREADDFDYLAFKVVLIIGLKGACTIRDLIRLENHDAQDFGTHLIFNSNKEGKIRQFMISNGDDGVDLVGIVRKYIALRPQYTESCRFFVGYSKGHCLSTPMGVNKIGKCPKIIAQYLGLSNAKRYTGRCFKRTGAKTGKSKKRR